MGKVLADPSSTSKPILWEFFYGYSDFRYFIFSQHRWKSLFLDKTLLIKSKGVEVLEELTET